MPEIFMHIHSQVEQMKVLKENDGFYELHAVVLSKALT